MAPEEATIPPADMTGTPLVFVEPGTRTPL